MPGVREEERKEVTVAKNGNTKESCVDGTVLYPNSGVIDQSSLNSTVYWGWGLEAGTLYSLCFLDSLWPINKPLASLAAFWNSD